MLELRKLIYLITGFLIIYFLPTENISVYGPVYEALGLAKWYAREHVLFCLVPAFFIAGAVSVFISKDSVIRYFGGQANKFISYGIASISGTILAVCSCTVLPLFAGIYKRGAGLGPAVTFLYSGPAINIFAIILSARVLGWEFGLGRATGAVIFSIIIGLLMHFIFIKEGNSSIENGDITTGKNQDTHSLAQTGLYLFSMLAILISANLAPSASNNSLWSLLFQLKWYFTGCFTIMLSFMIIKWFKKDDLISWIKETWKYAKQILPLLLAGILLAGFLLGRSGHEGAIPSHFVINLVGGNSISANFFASVFGAFMYFATLTEVPIVQGLLSAGMGKGPAMALLLAGPALSLPNMLVIKSVLGIKKTVVYIVLVSVIATFSGIIFGLIVS
ncbi:MAG: permease [Desulfobacteraceae bacterium]|nr:permease [Desulfobacteraceae bacterium]